MKLSLSTHLWSNRLIFFVIILKVIIWLIAVILMQPILGGLYAFGHFPDGYDLIASNLSAGNGYRVYSDTSLTMLRSPGFVLLLASLFLICGKSLFATQIMQLLMSMATATIVYNLAQRLFRVPSISLAASLIFLFHPAVIMAETRGGVESTLALCFTGCVALSCLAIDDPRWRNFIFLGVLFGWTMLVKSSVAIYFPAFVAVTLWWKPKNLPIYSLFARTLVAGLVSLVIISPWVIRNYTISGQFIPTMTVSGLALFQGVYIVKNFQSGKSSGILLQEAASEQSVIAREMDLKTHEGFFPQFYSPMDEIKFYNRLGSLAANDYLKSPMLIVEAIKHNSWAFWFQGRTHMSTILNAILTMPILILALCGSKIAIRINQNAWLLLIAIFTVMVPHLLIISVARYHMPLLPLMSILVSVGVAKVRKAEPVYRVPPDVGRGTRLPSWR